MREEVEEILGAVKKLASRYKKLASKPLGVTGEVAEYNVATLLGLELAEARTAGYDAVGPVGAKKSDQSPLSQRQSETWSTIGFYTTRARMGFSAVGSNERGLRASRNVGGESPRRRGCPGTSGLEGAE